MWLPPSALSRQLSKPKGSYPHCNLPNQAIWGKQILLMSNGTIFGMGSNVPKALGVQLKSTKLLHSWYLNYTALIKPK